MKPYLFLLILIVSLPDITYAATEYATFESFYKETASIGWTIAAVAALIAGAVIFFTGGTASPVVVAIGSWLGGMMGLSGAAATNAGLALLGGGSIASGGLGIAGGTALLTAALSFGTEVVVDYTIGKTYSEYQYSSLAAQSKDLVTLPMPINDSGPAAYDDAIELLGDIDEDLPANANSNQRLIRRAINRIETNTESLDKDESSKNESLLALLYFVSNDYVSAKKHADIAVMRARYAGIRRTLPAFIYATSSLYEEKYDFKKVTKDYFRYSVLAEPDNPLIPLLFAIYLDRINLRFNDGFLDETSLIQVFNIMTSPSIEDFRVENYAILLARYFVLLKIDQQTISFLVDTTNDNIKNNPETLITVTDSLHRYNRLINDANNIMGNYLSLELDDESKIKVYELNLLLVNYIKDKTRLASLVDELKQYQDKPPQADGGNWHLYIVLVILIIVGLFVAKNAPGKP